LVDAEHAEYDHGNRGQQPGDGRRHQAGGEQQDHGRKDAHRLPGAGTHGHRLTPHQLGRVDHQHVGVVEVLVQRLPAALEEQGVARREGDLAWAQALAAALDGEDDQIAAGRDHAGEDRLPDQTRARRDHHLGKTRGAVEQRFGDIAAAVFGAEGEMLLGGERACRLGRAAHDQVSPSATVGRRSGPPVRPSVIETRSSPGGMPCSIAARAAPTWPEDGRTRSWNRPSSSRYCSTRVRHGG
jgi:hypothetical protein